MSKQVERFSDALREKMYSRGIPLDQATDSVKGDLESWGAAAEAFAALEEAAQIIREAQTKIDIVTGRASVRRERAPWYSGPDLKSANWNAYRDRLFKKGWKDTVEDIDQSSTQVVALLNNPGESEFSARGLVLGYVQSGKTANMTGVIAKAADAGYRLVIILTGMIEKLRQQTQTRIQDDLISQEGVSEWMLWTTSDEDFSQRTYPGFTFNPAHRNLMIIKKESNVLGRIITKLKNTAKIDLDLPILVIDDECDQASVNAPGKNNDWKAINRLIRQMMSLFPRHTYVGYTATPFANVLIDPSFDPSRPPDLYPRDFIYSLSAPAEYFGTERLFGRDLLDAEVVLEEDEELDLIRTIPEDEIPHLKPTKDDPDFTITKSLDRAIDYYLIATAVRDLRGQRSAHSTMLVHTSHLRDDHRLIAQELQNALERKAHSLKTASVSYLERLEQIFDEEQASVPPTLFSNPEVNFKHLIKLIRSTVESSTIVIENSVTLAQDRLDYDGAPKDLGRRYICIGGNVISRGLTLEGLVSTFFMRTSKQYDTLMQMGRWFGYRKGYEDLPRVWMTADMQDNFRALATVEADLRSMIQVYEEEDPYITPMDVPVRIRQVPGLAITARNKMYAARQVRISFGGAHRQTTHFAHTDRAIQENNWKAAETLLGKAEKEVGEVAAPSGKGPLYQSVPRSIVEQFLHEYLIHPTHRDLVDSTSSDNHLLKYIAKRKELDPDDLSFWNIGMIQPQGTSAEGLLGSRKIKLINRSRLKNTLKNGDADIKALMSRSDILFDVPGETSGNNSWDALKKRRETILGVNSPLLLLYPIDKESPPARTVQRTPLNAVTDIMAFGILFPQTGEATSYVEVDVSEAFDEDDEKFDIEEQESSTL